MFRSRSNALGRQRPTRHLARVVLLATLALGVAASTAGIAAGTPTSILVIAKKGASGGLYLATARGFTLYTFSLDTRSKSACTGACAKLWPPVLVKKGTPLSKIEHGLKASRLGEIRRSDGTLQLTYEGKPLYRFAGDKLPGQRKGQGFERVWSVALVTPAAASAPIVTAPTSAPTTAPAAASTPPASSGSGSPPATSPQPTSPPPTSPPPTSPPTTAPPPTTPPTTQPPGGGYGY